MVAMDCSTWKFFVHEKKHTKWEKCVCLFSDFIFSSEFVLKSLVLYFLSFRLSTSMKLPFFNFSFTFLKMVPEWESLKTPPVLLHVNTESSENNIFGNDNAAGPPPPLNLSRPGDTDDYWWQKRQWRQSDLRNCYKRWSAWNLLHYNRQRTIADNNKQCTCFWIDRGLCDERK